MQIIFTGDEKMNSDINMTNKEYSDFVDTKAKKSKLFKNMFMAFLVGGIICVIGQIITNVALYYGVEKKQATIICTISLIFLGAFLTALKIYEKLGKIAGAGSVIPITGFSNSIVSPAIEYKTEGYILGIGANMFKVAGPVLVYGITTSGIIGLIYWIIEFLK